jgi:hypothetical protein
MDRLEKVEWYRIRKKKTSLMTNRGVKRVRRSEAATMWKREGRRVERKRDGPVGGKNPGERER